MVSNRVFGGTLATVALAGALLVAPTAAHALPSDEIGTMAQWEITGSSGSFSATAVFPASAGFPATTLTSTSTTLAAPSGETAFLGDSTDFGAEFGSTRSQPYLNISTAAGVTNSITTITFAGAQPAGWGFALGDIDADWVFIQAYAGPGMTDPLTVAELGFRSAGNYCNNVPKPHSCGLGPYTDQPVWVTAPEFFDGINYLPGTLRGDSLPGDPALTRDTSGAYGWFQPTVPIHTLELMFGPRDGFPVAQFWMVAPAPKVTIRGTVRTQGGDPPPTGTVVQVNEPDGTPILDIEDEPWQIPVDGSGNYNFETEQQDNYQLEVIVPGGYTPPDPVLVPGVPADPQDAEVEAPAFTVVPIKAPPPKPTPTSEPCPEPEPEPEPEPVLEPEPEPEPTSEPVTEPAPSPSPTMPSTDDPAESGGPGVAPILAGAGLVGAGLLTWWFIILGRRRKDDESENTDI